MNRNQNQNNQSQNRNQNNQNQNQNRNQNNQSQNRNENNQQKNSKREDSEESDLSDLQSSSPISNDRDEHNGGYARYAVTRGNHWDPKKNMIVSNTECAYEARDYANENQK